MAMHPMHVSFPEEEWIELQREAAREDCTHAQIIRVCVAEELRRRRLRQIRKELPK